MYVKVSILPFLAVILHLNKFVQGKKIFCYYSSFAQTRQGIGNFLPENINPHLCTHLIYAFVDITPDGTDLMPFNRNDQGPKGLYQRALALKEKNPSLKVLLAVGGWQIGSKPFIPMIRNESNRRVWIKNVINYLRKHGFDGFDVDWEFPATRGSPPEDKYRFTLLMQGLYEAFADEAAETGRDKLLLTLATASGTYYIDQSYEPHKIIKYIDYMLLMTYNYHGQWEKITGHHSGLNPHPNDPKTGEKAQLYQQWSIDYWLDVGISKSKLIVGIPTYGMSFTLADPYQNGVHAPANGGGKMGDYTRETGILAYYEVCLSLRDKGWRSEWLDDQMAPYAYGGDQWVGYENQQSIRHKADNIISRDLAGAFVWSVEMDDFRGTCGDGQYPLLSTIQEIIGTEGHSKSAARQGIVHPNPQPAPEMTHNVERKTRTFLTPSPVPEVSRSDNKLRFKKIRRRPGWKNLQRTAAAEAPEPETATDAPEVATTTESMMESTSEKLRVRWWTGPVYRKKTVTWRPWPTSSSSKSRRRPKVMWRKKGARKNANEISNSKMASELASNEVHEVNSWQTARWWSSAAEGLAGTHEVARLNARATGRPGMGIQRLPTTETTAGWSSYDVVTPANAPGASEVKSYCRNMGVGTFADPRSCDHFIICMPGNWQDYPPHVMSCPAGTRFDSSLKICNYASRVACH